MPPKRGCASLTTEQRETINRRRRELRAARKLAQGHQDLNKHHQEIYSDENLKRKSTTPEQRESKKTSS